MSIKFHTLSLKYSSKFFSWSLTIFAFSLVTVLKVVVNPKFDKVFIPDAEEPVLVLLSSDVCFLNLPFDNKEP